MSNKVKKWSEHSEMQYLEGRDKHRWSHDLTQLPTVRYFFGPWNNTALYYSAMCCKAWWWTIEVWRVYLFYFSHLVITWLCCCNANIYQCEDVIRHKGLCSISLFLSNSLWVIPLYFHLKTRKNSFAQVYMHTVFAAVCFTSVCHFLSKPQALWELNYFQLLQSLQTGFCFTFFLLCSLQHSQLPHLSARANEFPHDGRGCDARAAIGAL